MFFIIKASLEYLIKGDDNMATWIAHLRIAENILNMGYGFQPIPFIVGNIGPDYEKVKSLDSFLLSFSCSYYIYT